MGIMSIIEKSISLPRIYKYGTSVFGEECAVVRIYH